MYTININHTVHQKCPTCPNSNIQYIGTQAWCSSCNRAIRIIEQQTRVVPKMYQSNCKDKVSSAEVKIKAYLNEFCNKYGGVGDLEEINFLYRQVLEIKMKKGASTKNYRENSAVIVYVHFIDCHRLSIKQFCKKNQIDQKSFNKSYFTYQKLIKEKKLGQETQSSKQEYQGLKQEEQLKIQSTSQSQWQRQNFQARQGCMSDKMRTGIARELNGPQQSSAAQQSMAKNQHFDRPLNQHTIQHQLLNNIVLTSQIRSFLLSVFDSFFASLIYADKKILLIHELSEQILQVYQSLKLVFQSAVSSFYVTLQGSIGDDNFYKYLFYIVLRKISHGVSQVKYRKLIQEATGQAIKATLLKSVIKALDMKEETTSSFSGDSLFFVENSGTTGSEFVKIEEKD